MRKFYWPERGEITFNGQRQYFQEDLDHLTAIHAEYVRQSTVSRLTDDDVARLKHVDKLRNEYYRLRSQFLEKWELGGAPVAGTEKRTLDARKRIGDRRRRG